MSFSQLTVNHDISDISGDPEGSMSDSARPVSVEVEVVPHKEGKYPFSDTGVDAT